MSVLKLFKPSPANRERLKSALTARDAAQRSITESAETLERIESVITTADTAARTAAKATQAATEARREWVRGGCKYSESIRLQSLDDAAAEAARVAARAAVDAEAVRKTGTMARAEDAVRLAQTDLRGCGEEITTAIDVIIAAELSPDCRELENLADRYRTVRFKLMAERQTMGSEGAAVITASLARAYIKPFDEERSAARAHDFVEGTPGRDEAAFEQLMMPGRERAAQLRVNPDA
jgi:hypothetical protein